MKSRFTFTLVLFLIGYQFLHAQMTKCGGTLSAGPDIQFCNSPDGETLSLNATATNNVVNIHWTDESIEDKMSLHPEITIEQTTTFHIEADIVTGNLVTNGDFGTTPIDVPSTEFYSDYKHRTIGDFPPTPPAKGDPPPLYLPEGRYSVDQVYGTCSDHTTGNGTGNMMVVNLVSGEYKIWCQTVNVERNTDYSFSAWVANIYSNQVFTPPGGGDGEENDIDEDGIPNDRDNCPNTPNPDQADKNGDGIGDACQDDIDGDGVPNDSDNCPNTPNPGQEDKDGNGVGDACEGANDKDGDGIPDDSDNCPDTPNPGQEDENGNGIGDACEDTDGGGGGSGGGDRDGDGVPDASDNCPETPNPDQDDSDGDGIGDACEDGTNPFPDGGCAPQFQLVINGQLVGDVVTAGDFCAWKNIYRVWNSGNSTTAEICLIGVCDQSDMQPAALDDISFGATCKLQDEVTVYVDNISADVLDPELLSCENEEVTIQGTFEADGSDISFIWSTNGQIIQGANSQTLSVIEPGEYTFSALNPETQCFASATTTVGDDLIFPEAVLAEVSSINCANTSLVLDASGSTQGETITYQWDEFAGNIVSGGNTPTPTIDKEGTYYLTVTNTKNGCSDELSVFVQENFDTPDLTAPVSSIELGCDVSSAMITPQLNSDPNNVSFEWTSNGNQVGDELALDVTSAGTYTLVATDEDSQCTSTISVDVSGEATLPDLSIEGGGEINCLNTEVALSGSSTTDGDLVYTWSKDGNDIATSSDVTVTEGGNYTLSIYNQSNGCEATQTITINQNTDLPTVNASSPGDLNCYNNGVVELSSSTSGGNALAYQWSTNDGNIQSGANQPNPSVDAPGNYHLLVTNSENGCSATADVQVNENMTPPPSVETSEVAINCYNPLGSLGDSGLSTNGNYTFQWTGSGILSGQNTGEVQVDAPGTYELVITDNTNGCSSTSVINVTADMEQPTATAVGEQLNCHNPTVIIDGSQSSDGTISYAWSTQDGHIISGTDNEQVEIDAPGTYHFEVKNYENGCTASTDVVITEAPALEASVNVTSPLCFGDASGSASVDVTSGTTPYTYVWSDANSSTGKSVTGLAAGSYEVTVSDGIGCTMTIPVVISEPSALDVSATASGESSAGQKDGAASVTVANGTAPYQYLWSNGETTSTISGLEPGTYDVTVTDANGCTSTASVVVEGVDCSIDGAIEANNVSCNGLADGFAELKITGAADPISYTWSNDETSSSITGLGVGEYTVTATDANGCPFITNVVITQPDALSIAFETEDILCNGDENGSATAIVTGGTAPYNYAWSNGETGASIDNQSGGDFMLTVSDANGCENTQEITIVEPQALAITGNLTQVSTNGNNDGAIVTQVTGGTSPYKYKWDNGEETPDISGLTVGEYTVVVVDANGCEISETFTIAEPGAVVITVSSKDVSCYGEMNGEASVDVSQGVEPFTYLWSNGEKTKTITGLDVGTYSVVVTDATGTTNTGSVTIESPDALQTLVITSNVKCNGGNDGGAEIKGSTGGVAPYSYSWDTGETSETISGLPAGDYEFITSDANGCAKKNTISIFEPDPFVANEEIADATETNDQGAISLKPTGGTKPYNYQWSNGETSAEITGLSAGDYTVTITDENDCEYEFTYTVNEKTSNEDLALELGLEIYPNPSNDVFILDFKQSLKEDFEIQIFDITGRKIHHIVTNGNHANQYIIDFTNQASSVYVLKMMYGKELITRKLILSK